MKVSKKTLEELVSHLNKVYADKKQLKKFELNEAQCYGGYCLTTDSGSYHVTKRMPGKELYAYLNGALDFVGRRGI